MDARLKSIEMAFCAGKWAPRQSKIFQSSQLKSIELCFNRVSIGTIDISIVRVFSDGGTCGAGSCWVCEGVRGWRTAHVSAVWCACFLAGGVNT